MMRREWIHRDPLPGNDAAADGDQGNADQGNNAGAGEQNPLLGGDQGGDQQNNQSAFEVPEKFRVIGEGDQLDHKATLGKVLESYSHLEKRIGTGDLPPKTADEYKLENFLPEGLEADQEKLKPILEEMHKLGLTNKQVQGVMSIYGQSIGSAMAVEKQTHQAAVEALKSEWGDKYQDNLTLANMVVNALATPEERQMFQNAKYSNDPFLLKFLAKVGAEFSEDNLPEQMTDEEADNVDELRTSEAYTNPNHPDHKRVVAKVNEAYRKGYKAKN